MRIVQVLPELNEGGVERGVVESNREYVQQGLESFVISAGGKLVDQVAKDGGTHINLDVCSKNIFTVFARVRQLKIVLDRLQADVIHVRSRVPAWMVRFANKSTPVVSTVHGFNSVSRYSEIMQRADAVICVSNSIKDYIQLHYKTKDNIITVIPRGIDLDLFNQTNTDSHFVDDFIKTHKLANKLVIASIGRVTQLKDYETFIRAIEIVKNQKPNQDVVGLIVGGVREDKQAYFKSLKVLIGELGLDENIVFTGSQKKVAEIYQLSNVVVSCSKKPESFGRSVAESIAMNTPVVATNHGGVKDIILQGENGYFFEIGDEHELAQNILKSLTLDFDGYKYISDHFSLANMINKTLMVYNKVTQ